MASTSAVRAGTASRQDAALVALAAAAAFGCFLLPVFNPDLEWHLSAARWMVEHRALPRAEWLSHTMPGAPWVDFEWLSQLVFLAADAAFGGWGLWAVKVLLLSASSAALWPQLRRAGLRPPLAALAVLWFSAAVFPYADLRPDNFSLLFFVLSLGALDVPGLRGRRGLACAAAFYCLWSNLHMGFVFGLALLAARACGEVLDGKGLSAGRLFAAAAAGSLLNPFGHRLAAVVVMHSFYQPLMRQLIDEWKPLPLDYPLFQPGAALLAAGVLAVVVDAVRTRRPALSRLLPLSGLALATLLQRRDVLYLAPTALVALAAIASPWTSRPRRGVRLAQAVLACALAGHLLLRVAPELLSARGWPRPPAPSARVAAFLRDRSAVLTGTRLYNEVADGDHLGAVLFPRYRIFCDGRYLFMPLLAAAKDAAASPARWQDLMARHAVEIAVVHTTSVYRSYFPAPQWTQVYREGGYAVMVREGAAPRDWLKAQEIH